jgi:hypothetical protein
MKLYNCIQYMSFEGNLIGYAVGYSGFDEPINLKTTAIKPAFNSIKSHVKVPSNPTPAHKGMGIVFSD